MLNRVESQHLPITTTLYTEVKPNDNDSRQGEIKKIKWNNAKAPECKNILQKEESKRILEEAAIELENNQVNNSVNLFTKLMQYVSKPLEFILKIGDKKLERKPWYDKECQKSKKDTLNQLNKLAKINNIRQPKKYQKEKNSLPTKKDGPKKTYKG